MGVGGGIGMAISRFTGRKLRLVALASAQLVCMAAWADDAQRIEALEQRLARSLALIEQLNARVQQLEAARAAPPPAATAAAATTDPGAQQARIERLEQTVQGMSETTARTRDLGIPLHGFADVGYWRQTRLFPGRKAGFALGNLDLYMTPEIGDRVRSIIELVFEYGPDEGGVATDLERLQFGYTFSDALTLWAGRFHTPYGYWNTAFHHGQQIQTAASRPSFIDFEDRGGILPAHAIGLMASGSTRAGGGRVSYDAYLANGDQIVDGVLDMNAFGDNDTNKLVGGNLRYTFGGALEGLTLGVHGLTQKVVAVDGGTQLSNTRVNKFGGLAVFDTERWEVIGEYYRFRNQDLAGGTGRHSSWAGFAQAGYRFAPGWTPYARFERAALDQGDAYFANQDSGRSYRAGIVGLRYDLTANAALKFELNQVRQEQAGGGDVHSHGARFQFAVRF
jgi:hypothetical protein